MKNEKDIKSTEISSIREDVKTIKQWVTFFGLIFVFSLMITAVVVIHNLTS